MRYSLQYPKPLLSIIFLIALFAIVFASITPSASAIIREKTTQASLVNIQCLQLEKNSISAKQLFDNPNLKWKSCSHEANFGFTEDNVWIKFQIKNLQDTTSEHFLLIDYPLLDEITLYQKSNDRLVRYKTLGDRQAFQNRLFNHRGFIYSLSLNFGETHQYLLNINSTSSLSIPLKLWSKDTFYQAQIHETAIQGLFYGILLVMILYNLFIYLSTRITSYLYYVTYVLSFVFFQFTLSGYSYQLLWPDFPSWHHLSVNFGLSFCLLLAMIFTKSFLNIPKEKLSARWIKFLIIALFISTILSLIIPYRWSSTLGINLGIIGLSSIIIIGIMQWYKGNSSAGYLVIAWITLVISALCYALTKFGYLPIIPFTEHYLQIGSVIEVILLSFALADRINQERFAKIEAQTELIEMQKQSNIVLEQKVKDRTKELEEVNKKLTALNNSDPMTGVKNRRYFDEQIKIEYKRANRSRSMISITMIDIDHFKSINDRFGHPFGDECIIKVAQCIQQIAKRPCDTVARYGGEEFAAILPDTDKEGAQKVAEKIRSQIENLELYFDRQKITITASIGFYSCLVTAYEDCLPDDALKKADDALYQAKQNGRNQVVAF